VSNVESWARVGGERRPSRSSSGTGVYLGAFPVRVARSWWARDASALAICLRTHLDNHRADLDGLERPSAGGRSPD